MTVHIVYETHATTEDNESGHATGWRPGRLSAVGRANAVELGARRRGDVSTVFCSDLHRAVQTATIAFAGTDTPILLDWRLRECDFGELNGARRELVKAHTDLDLPFPGGESRRAAVARVGRFLRDLPTRWEGQRVLVIGHEATRFALDHYLAGVPLEDLVGADFAWREGWEYRLD